MRTSPLVGFNHSDFGCLWGCHDEDDNAYFVADDVAKMFGLSTMKPFEIYLLPGRDLGRENLGQFISEEGLKAVWDAYEPWYTSHTCKAHEWLETEVLPVIRKMKVKDPPLTYTPAFDYWALAFAELFWAYIIVSFSISVILHLV